MAPEFSSIEEYLGRNTHEYYDILRVVGGGRWRPEGDTRVRGLLLRHGSKRGTFYCATPSLAKIRHDLIDIRQPINTENLFVPRDPALFD